MAEIAPRNVAGFLKTPPTGLRFVVFFGPDEGLVREQARAVTQHFVPEDDGFRVVELDAATLKDDPARLADEAAAISMFGGQRVVRLRDATDSISGPIKSFLDTLPGDAVVVAESAGLTKRSSIVKAAIASPAAAAIACYADTVRDIGGLIDDTVRGANLRIEPDARTTLAERLGEDRAMSRQSLDLLLLYKGSETSPITVAEVIDALGPPETSTAQDLCDAVAVGQVEAALGHYETCIRVGVAIPAVLRILADHLRAVRTAQSKVQGGMAPAGAAKSLRIHFTREKAFLAALKIWTPVKLDRADTLLFEAERDTRRYGQMDVAILGQTVLRIAMLAGAGRRGRER